jgi:Uri superfamily endonuclease
MASNPNKKPAPLKGDYLLLVELFKSTNIALARRGAVTLIPGTYIYVGSARGSGGLAGRLRRHLRRDKQRHWHIDYLLEKGRVVGIVPMPVEDGGERMECRIARAMGEVWGGGSAVAGFGSSDCGFGSHLYRVGGVIDRLQKGGREG